MRDRVSGAHSVPLPGWTGRWTDGTAHLLDVAEGSLSRDAAESDDLDALASLTESLAVAGRTASWMAFTEAPLLARRDEEDCRLSSREQTLAKNLPSIERVCERFITRLGERSELVPVSRVKKPARRALERLSAHTEDWAGRTLAGPVPRRALAITREEDADLYENRMVTELVHPILTTALSDRIRRLRRLATDLADLTRAKDEGTHFRRERLYEFWGADGARAAQSEGQADETLKELRRLAGWVQSLRGSALSVVLRGRRTGQRSLRNTNVIANDRHYRAAGDVWNAYAQPQEAVETVEERHSRFLSRHQAFDNYAIGLVVRSLNDLGYRPAAAEMPATVVLPGPWGRVTMARSPDGVITLASHGRQTRFVPLLDVVASGDDQATIAARWASLAAAAEVPTVVVYLAASKAIQELPLNLAAAMMSAGRDSADRDARLTGVPVSPLETTSLERVARAVSIALLESTLTAYPAEVRLGDGRVPERLINEILNAFPAQAGHSPLFHRPVNGSLMIRRPLSAAERMKLEGAIRQLTAKTSSLGWERDLAAEINLLGTAIKSAADSLGGLLTCPLCQASADTREVDRDGAFFAITCQFCKARWGLDRCGNCGGRIPVIEPRHAISNPGAAGPGWVERIYGRDALASPCWAGSRVQRYICPECRSCALAGSPEGAGCVRCRA
jgi:hypothetical protein